MYGENAPPSWARLPGARCRAVEHLTKLDGLKEFELFEGLEEGFFQDLTIAAEVLELGADTALTGRASLRGPCTSSARDG